MWESEQAPRIALSQRTKIHTHAHTQRHIKLAHADLPE